MDPVLTTDRDWPDRVLRQVRTQLRLRVVQKADTPSAAVRTTATSVAVAQSAPALPAASWVANDWVANYKDGTQHSR